jgi:lipoteichoic acid synthase
MKLNLSDKVVNGDLLRFYKPNDFVPIDPTDYDYTYREDSQTSAPTTPDHK